jgi:hypothetical protein
MKTLEPKDELLIQNKIDGNLSAEEEIEFRELIETSPHARKFYEDLLSLQHALGMDSKGIPPVDFVEEILHVVKSKQKPPKPEMDTRQFWAFLSQINFMAYAAILLVGLFIGSLMTYLGNSNNQLTDERQFSGTISALSAMNFDYNQDGTQIKIQELITPKVKIATIFIHTEEPVQCSISGNDAKVIEKNILLQFADGKFLPLESGNEALQYSCSGWIVFQIKGVTDTNSPNKLSLVFTKNGTVIKQLYLN